MARICDRCPAIIFVTSMSCRSSAWHHPDLLAAVCISAFVIRCHIMHIS
jgi:hypothetical protein